MSKKLSEIRSIISCCYIVVDESEFIKVKKWKKFDRILEYGFHFFNCFNELLTVYNGGPIRVDGAFYVIDTNNTLLKIDYAL